MVLALLPGAVETKVRPAVIVASEAYLAERPDVLVGILTTRLPPKMSSSDHLLRDWHAAGLRAPSCFRAYIITIHRSNLTAIGRLSKHDFSMVRGCVKAAFATHPD